jgi:predicted Rossmann fold flavoprotein
MSADVKGASCHIAIVGGGAAGLAAAIFAAEEARSLGHADPCITVLESAAKIGAKILISGGGRCNVTHEIVTSDDFWGARAPIRNVLAAFDADAARRWFFGLGVELKREPTGKLFPVTDRARTVVDALINRCRALGVKVRTGSRIESIHLENGRFAVRSPDVELRASRVVVATGGRSLPRTGSDGSGYALAESLGHTVSATHPALVPLVLEPDFFHAGLRGVSHPAELSTWANGKRVDIRSGDLLWTHFGISGPVVLDASRHWILARARGDAAELRLRFPWNGDGRDVEAEMLALASARPRLSLQGALADRLPDRLAAALLRHARVAGGTPIGQLERESRRRVVQVLTELPLPVARSRGWDHAEVTTGGVPLAEIDYRTMESRACAGAYLVGEILDCDGRIGGFNFQWAWATGYLAGRAAARSVLRDTAPGYSDTP